MKVENLKVEMIVKNYKELCSLLEVEHKRSGNAKNSQIKEFERYFSFEKHKGNSLIIKELYNKPLEKIDNRTVGNNVAPYVEDTELLLIDLLLCAENEEIKIPTNALLQVLKIVNYNYRHFMYDKRPLLSKDLNMDIAYIDDYYSNVGSMLTSNINTVINRLVKKKLIIHKEIFMIKVVETVAPAYNDNGDAKLIVNTSIDRYGNEVLKYEAPTLRINEYYKEANTEELRKILKIEREIFVELGMNKDSKYNELFKNGKKNKYDKLLREHLLSEMNVLFKFKSHHLIFNHDDVEKEKYSILGQVEKDKLESKINKEVQFRIIENVDNRIEKFNNDIQLQYIEHFGTEKELNSNKMLKGKKEYGDNYLKLNKILIHNNEAAAKDLNSLIKLMIDNDYLITNYKSIHLNP